MTGAPIGRVPRRLSGNVDSVETGGGTLRIIGWALASRVTLCCGGRSVSTTPSILRRDAAEALGVAADAARYGYELTLRDPGPGPALLVYEPATGTAGDILAAIVPGTGGTAPDTHRLSWFPKRVAGVFERYAAEHLDCVCQGHPLQDTKGRTLGHIDRIRVNGTRMTVEGWADANRLILLTGELRHVVEPQLLRRDVAEATGLPGELGFFLEAVGPGAHQTGDVPILIVEPKSGTPVAVPLPLPAAGQARRKLLLRFLREMIGVAPSVVKWRLTRDPRHRAAIKRALGLTGIAQAEALNPEVLAQAEAPKALPRDSRITIILPVYNAFDILPEVLDRAVHNTDLPYHLYVIEDGSSDERVRPFLQEWAAVQHAVDPTRVTLIENQQNLGFIGSVNKGLALARKDGHPVVLLNSDAFVPKGWASRLIRPIAEDTSVATVTPMSNDAEIFSVPAICTRTVLEPGMADAIDALAQRLHPDNGLVEAPTGVGFCMAVNPVFLNRVTSLDTVFGRGYGEEVDWCQKTRALGGRHVGIANLFVEHRGGESFGSEEKLKLVAANNARISRRYPTYDAEVQSFIAADPMITTRLALAVAWVAAWVAAAEDRRAPIYMAHSLGGGAETYLQKRIADEMAATGRPAVILRVGGPRRWRIEVISDCGQTVGETNDFDLVRSILSPLTRREIVYSNAVGDPDPEELPARLLDLVDDGDSRVEVLFHDFFALSPSYTLLDGDGHYRGPLSDAAARAGDRVHQSRRADGSLAELTEWQDAWGALLARADMLHVFSQDSRDQIVAAMPTLAGSVVVTPHHLPVTPPMLNAPPDGHRTIAVLGNIGFQKGAALLQDLAKLMKRPDAPGLVLIGNIDPAYALPDHVPVHGTYRVEDLPELAQRYRVTEWLVPSIWPETFSYTTHEALATGLPVWCFDIGGQGEAARTAPNGRTVPLEPEADAALALFQALTAAARTPIPEAAK